MGQIDTSFLVRCIATLEKAHKLLLVADPQNIEFDLYRSACIKEFEIILEQSGKLLRKTLKPYYSSTKEVDKLYFKDLFRAAALWSLIDDATADRWLDYRDKRNNTAYDYGVNFAEEILLELPSFIKDAAALAEIADQQNV